MQSDIKNKMMKNRKTVAFRIMMFIIAGLLTINQQTNAQINKINDTLVKDSLPKKPPEFIVSGAKLLDLPGKSIHDPIIQKLINSGVSSCVPVPFDKDSLQFNKDSVVNYLALSSDYVFPNYGMTLIFHNDILYRIVFYNQSFSMRGQNWKQYPGELPYGLSFEMTRAKVYSLLGPSDTCGDISCDDYNKRNLKIQFSSDDREHATIAFVSIRQ